MKLKIAKIHLCRHRRGVTKWAERGIKESKRFNLFASQFPFLTDNLLKVNEKVMDTFI